MVYRVTDIKVDLDRDPNGLPRQIAKKTSVPIEEIRDVHVVRKALDAREKDRLFFVYTVDITLSEKGTKLIS
ncbi:MAG: hypothetical protein WC834_01230, partial [Eubacteriales bacterium]